MPKKYTPNDHHWSEDRGCFVLTLVNGHECLVDLEDIDIAMARRWMARADRGTHYAMASIYENGDGTSRKTSLHREIMGAKKGEIVDHINGDGMDNRRSNLRIVSAHQNQHNRRGPNRDNTSGYMGVSFDSFAGKYKASIRIDGKQVSLGRFDNPRHAALIRDMAALELHGDFAFTNFDVLTYG